MKIINEKGKLFGIINIVDLLVVLFIIAVVGGISWKIFGNKISQQVEQANIARNGIDVTYTVRCSGVRDNLVESAFAVGFPQQLAVNTGLVDDAYIVDAYTEPSKVLSTDGEFAKMVEYDRSDIIFVIKARVVKGDYIVVGTQEVRIGRTHIVKSRFVEFSGTIETMEFDVDEFLKG